MANRSKQSASGSFPIRLCPKNGPGLAGNGNIVLTRVEFRANGKRLAVSSAEHDHAQPGFSAAKTIDDDPKTGWAINVGKGSRPSAKMNAPHEARYLLKTAGARRSVD